MKAIKNYFSRFRNNQLALGLIATFFITLVFMYKAYPSLIFLGISAAWGFLYFCLLIEVLRTTAIFFKRYTINHNASKVGSYVLEYSWNCALLCLFSSLFVLGMIEMSKSRTYMSSLHVQCAKLEDDLACGKLADMLKNRVALPEEILDVAQIYQWSIKGGHPEYITPFLNYLRERPRILKDFYEYGLQLSSEEVKSNPENVSILERHAELLSNAGFLNEAVKFHTKALQEIDRAKQNILKEKRSQIAEIRLKIRKARTRLPANQTEKK